MADMDPPEGIMGEDTEEPKRKGYAQIANEARIERIAEKGGNWRTRAAKSFGRNPLWFTIKATVLGFLGLGAAGAIVSSIGDDPPAQIVDEQEQGSVSGETPEQNDDFNNPLTSTLAPSTSTTVAPTTTTLPEPDPTAIDTVFECDGGYLSEALDPRNGQGDGIDSQDYPANGVRACTPLPPQANGKSSNTIFPAFDGGTGLLQGATMDGAKPTLER